MTTVESTSQSITSEVAGGVIEPFVADSTAPAFAFVRYLTVRPDATVESHDEAIVRVHLLAQQDGGFVALVPALPGASTQGADRNDALDMVRESLQGFVAVADPEDFVPPGRQELSDCGETVLIRVPLDEAATGTPAA